jgi:hypothetical protein
VCSGGAYDDKRRRRKRQCHENDHLKNNSKNLVAAPPLGEDSSIVVSQGARPHQILNGTIDAGKEITYDKKAERESPPGTSQKG